MLITFFDIKCIIYFAFILQGQAVNQDYYVEILKWLLEAVSRKRPELWPKNQLVKWNTHPLPLFWLRATSGCFLK